MIYTMTLNPSIDYIVRVDSLEIGSVNRMTSDDKFPGGKGINVSRILKRIDAQSTALGFLGGFTGKFIEDCLNEEEIPTNFTTIQSDTRINIKLKAGEETEINGQGPVLTDEEISELKASLSKVGKGDIVVLAGSLPAGLSQGFYQELIEIIKDKEADFVIDTKPNNHELAELYNTTFSGLDDIITYGKKMLADGAQNVIISMAGDGALLFTQQGVYQTNVLKRELKNSVGAGDSMIAGFIGEYSKTKNPVESFKWGVACGSATAFSDDLATGEFIQELLPEVNITKL